MAAGAPSRVLFILGATATGKTEVAIETARRVGGEIINADSRAFFEGLDIVTAKPTPGERLEIPHHLVDCVPFDGTYDAMSFRRDVERLIPEIVSRAGVPMLVGGGTLYLGAILRGLFDGPPKDHALRQRLGNEPLAASYERLVSIDPAACATIHANDRQRIVRALEVFELTGRPISELQAEAQPLPLRSCIVGLTRNREEHRRAIAERSHRMVEAGLLDEVRRLRERGLEEGMQAYRTIGIPEAAAVLDGRASRDSLADELSRKTWALVRRQMSWFRREEGVRWIDITGMAPGAVAERIVEQWTTEDE